jgi:hypothetical protein
MRVVGIGMRRETEMVRRGDEMEPDGLRGEVVVDGNREDRTGEQCSMHKPEYFLGLVFLL